MPLDILSNSTTLLKISDIRTDGGTQPRAGLTSQIIIEYSEAISGPNDWPFPPLVVYFDGSDYWLADGFHRLAAAKMYADQNRIAYSIVADIRQGTQRDAILYSVGANADHGLRRTSEDKRRSVLRLLEDSEWSQWSNREIARRCRVDEKTVRTLRDSLSAENPQIERKVERNGTVYTQNTAKIGAKPTASVDDLTRHIGSWLSNQEGNAVRILGVAADRNSTYRNQIVNLLHRRKVRFTNADLEQAIAEVLTNLRNTVGESATVTGPMPTMSHKDVEDLKARQAAPPTDNTSLSVDTPAPVVPMSKALSTPSYNLDFEEWIDDGWKILMPGGKWQAVNHNQQLATAVVSSSEILLNLMRLRKWSSENYFIDEDTPDSATVRKETETARWAWGISRQLSDIHTKLLDASRDSLDHAPLDGPLLANINKAINHVLDAKTSLAKAISTGRIS